MKHARILENRKALKSFWRCSCDVLGPLRNQYSTTHLILTIFSCANEHLSRFGCFCFFFFLRFFGFSVHRTLRIFRILTFGFSVFLKNTYGLSDLVSDVVFGFSYLDSGFSSIWATVLRKMPSLFITANESVHVTLNRISKQCFGYKLNFIFTIKSNSEGIMGTFQGMEVLHSSCRFFSLQFYDA